MACVELWLTCVELGQGALVELLLDAAEVGLGSAELQRLDLEGALNSAELLLSCCELLLTCVELVLNGMDMG